jgi:hypothetical protein
MRLAVITLCVALSLTAKAGDSITIRDAFRQMPDSLMPTLTQNNRLDFLDFHDAGMKAEVKNRLGGTSLMTALTNDSLSMQVSPALRVDMLLLTLPEPLDSVNQVIVVGETFLADSVYGETTIHYFTTDWQPISNPPLDKIQQQRIDGLRLQTILKWDDEILNKVNNII